MQLAQSLLDAVCAQTTIEEFPVRKREDMGDFVKLAGALAIFAVTFTAFAAFFNLAALERFGENSRRFCLERRAYTGETQGLSGSIRTGKTVASRPP